MCHVRKKQRWVSFPAPSGLEVLSTPRYQTKAQQELQGLRQTG